MSGELITVLISSAIAILGALTSLVVSTLKAKETSVKTEQTDLKIDKIEKAIEAGTGNFWLICPKCGTKIYLKDIDIRRD